MDLLTGRQIGKARDRLGRRRSGLARRAGSSLSVVNRAEAADGDAVVTIAQTAAPRLAFLEVGEALATREQPCPSAEPTILRFPVARTHASAAEICISCRMTAAEVRACLIALKNRRLVAGRSDPAAALRDPRRIFVVTGEGRRKAGISAMKWQEA